MAAISGSPSLPQPHTTNPHSTHPFTCNSCQVAFRSSELQRAHMQTDWHRYNLKRRVASLPPLSSEIFTEKVLANKASAAATAARASFEKSCAACQKTYYSENAYQNHLNSQKHRSNVTKQRMSGPTATDEDAASVVSSAFSLGEPMDSKQNTEVKDKAVDEEFSKVVGKLQNSSLEDDDPVSRRPSRPHHSGSGNERTEHPLSPVKSEESKPEETGKPVLTCLFCNFKSPTFPLNLLHMSRYHSMFIPEQEYLVDSEGLIEYLYAKVSEGHECLYCGKAAHTAAGIQTHMRDRGHCMIAFDSEEEMLEVGDFYDFTSTWSDKGGSGSDDEWEDADGTDDSASTEGGGVKLASRGKTKGQLSSTAVNEEDGWETDSSVSTVPTDELTAVPLDDRSHRYARLGHHRHHSHTDPRPHRAADGFHSHAHATPHAVYHDEYELHLPSGRTAGHRSLRVYFRQNLRNYPSAAERAEQQQRAIEAGTADADVDADGDVDMEGGSVGPVARTNERDRGRQLMSRGNGGMGLALASDAQKKEARATERRERRREGRDRTRYQAGNEKRANFQKHFRDPLLQ